MKNKWNIVLLLVVYCTNLKAQEVYSYRASHYSESLELLKDKTFNYSQTGNFQNKSIITGNWKIENDSVLILNSIPKMPKIIVTESFKKDNRKTCVSVKNTSGDLLNYVIYLVNKNNDTTILKDQFSKSVLSGKFKSFFIVDGKSMYSPVYKIKNKRSNNFDVKFETRRVFTDERWTFYGDYIISRWWDGKTLLKLAKESNNR